MSSVEAERRVAERARLEVMQERDALLKTLQEDGRKRQALGEQVEALEVSRSTSQDDLHEAWLVSAYMVALD